MKMLPPPQEALRQQRLEAARLADPFHAMPAASQQGQQKLPANPVVLALRRIPDPGCEADPRTPDRLRIANEVAQHFGWREAPPPSRGSDGSAVRAFRHFCSKEQVRRTRAELDAYLDRFKRNDPQRPRQSSRHAHAPVRNPILDALDFGGSSPAGR